MASIAVAGSVAQRVGYGGHAWALLQYVLGFRRLGYKVTFIDQLTPEMTLDRAGHPSRRGQARGVRWLARTMSGVEMGDQYSLLLGGGEQSVGLSRHEARERVAQAELLLNVMGFITDDEIMGSARRRVFLDIDPGFGQMWHELGLADVFRGHDAFVTIAENISEADCSIPTCGLDWITTRPPVTLDSWPSLNGGSAFTTVATWRGPFEPIEFAGRRYGVRAHEFRRFAELPGLIPEPFEIALEIDAADRKDVQLLVERGWKLVDPIAAAGDPERYRSFIQRSKAEVMIAKNMYVETRSGWFSDRSACYLASGKPVLAQDTGFARNYPVGEGLLSFRDLEEAADGAREISRNWGKHSKAAREIAEEHFDARKVLRRLLDDLGVG